MDILDVIERAIEAQQRESRIRAEQSSIRAQRRTQQRAWNDFVAPFKPVAHEILAHFNLDPYAHLFLASPDGLAILAICCNCAAKWYDPNLYEHKPDLVSLVTSTDIECWQEAGIVYIETCVGQVSFHALYGEDKGLPEANGRTWNGLEMQFNAALVAKAFLYGWSKYALEQVIQLNVAENAA